MKKTLSAALLFTTFFAACDKDDDNTTAKAAENSAVVKTFFLNTPVTILATGSGNYEYGFRFSVTQSGRITRLGSRMPDAGNYRVTLWDASVTPKVVLGSATVTQAAAATTYTTIAAGPIAVTPGKDYLVSIWSSGKWYEIRPAAGASVFSYPINVGSVSIKGYQWIGTPSTPQAYPSNSETTYVAGLPDFEFQPD